MSLTETEQFVAPAHSSEEARILDLVQRRFASAKRLRRSRELTWYLDLAFYIGDQYAHLADDKTQILTGAKDSKVPKHRVRAVSNKVAPACDHLVAQLTRSMPTLRASPQTEDPEDNDAATLSTSVLTHEWRRMDLTLLDHDIKTWKTITGTAGLWLRWNGMLGPMKRDGSGPRGEIEPIVVTPFNMYPDPSASRNIRWFIHASEEDVDEIKDQFPERAHLISPDSGVREGSSHYERRLRAMMGATLGFANEMMPTENTCTVMTYWSPRSREHPNGLMAICTSSALLWAGDNPWAHFGQDWCPIEIFRHKALSASFWGKGAVSDAIPIQKERNRTLSQIIEHRNRVTGGRYWIPRGCRVNVNAMTDAPSEKVWYTPAPPEVGGGRAYRPEREDPPPLPAGLFRLLDTLAREIEDCFSYHEVSKGQAPPGVKSGVAIEQLQEKDEAPNVPVSIRDNVAWSRVGRRILALVQDQWDEERTIQVHGDDGYEELVAFKGMDIPGSMDVEVDADTLLPITRAGRIAALTDFAERGILSPMEVREALFGGFGTVRAAINRASLDVRKQKREIRRMCRGEWAPVDNFDDHMQHLMALNQFRKSPRFELVRGKEILVADAAGQPQGVSTIGAMFEAHARAHGVILAMQMAQNTPQEATEGEQPRTQEAEPAAM